MWPSGALPAAGATVLHQGAASGDVFFSLGHGGGGGPWSPFRV